MSFPHTGSTVLTNGVSGCSRLAVSKDTHEAVSRLIGPAVCRTKLIKIIYFDFSMGSVDLLSLHYLEIRERL